MKVLSKLLLAIVLLPLTLAWGELFTRFLLPQSVDTILDILVPDAEMGYIYQPKSKSHERGRGYDVPFEINSLGLRDREYSPAASDAFRVLLVGDSFAVSHGESLQHSLPAQLERALEAEIAREGGGQSIEVINAANAGYTPYNYWKSYRRWGLVFKPKMIVVALFTGNDYVCEQPDVRFLVRDGLVQARYREGETPRLRRKSPLYTLRKMLARNSELYVLFRNYFYYNERIDRLRHGKGRIDSGALEELLPFVVPQPDQVARGWSRASDYLARLQADCAADSVGVIVLRVPVKLEVDGARREQCARIAAARGCGLDPGQPGEAIAALCLERGLPLFDPLVAIKARHAVEPCYFTYDDHWNRRGIEAAAVATASEWHALRLPPFK
jgi:hypothetical protein